MLLVYDVQLELRRDATGADLVRLKDHFRTLKIEAIGLDQDDLLRTIDEVSFTIYGNFGPFMMKRMVKECTEKIFPGSIAALFQNG